MDFNLSRPMLSDVRVRRALRLAVDRKALRDEREPRRRQSSKTAFSRP